MSEQDQYTERESENLHEGITQLYATQLTETLHTGYPNETTTAFFIERLVGAETLRRAYMTGDFYDVRASIDRQLGDGTFDTILERSEPSDALAYLVSQMDNAEEQYDYMEWILDNNVMSELISTRLVNL